MKICSFAGHSTICNEKEIKIKLRKEIINLIENENVTVFYNGNKGAFDSLCAHCINELKKEYPFIKSYWILSYIPGKRNEYTDSILRLFDDTIYPDIENVPPRYAILKRNEWMINNSDFLIAYVEHHLGGASKTLRYAESKKHVSIINVANHEDLPFLSSKSFFIYQQNAYKINHLHFLLLLSFQVQS